MWTIQIAKSADKVLKKAPLEIRNAFDAWKNVIQLQGVSGLKAIMALEIIPSKVTGKVLDHLRLTPIGESFI